MVDEEMPRWRQLRVRAFIMDVTVREIAERCGYHREYASQLLRGDTHSEPGLDNVERILDEIETEREGNHDNATA